MPTSFTIATDLRRKAVARASADGLSLSSAVRLLLAGYASGRITIAAVPMNDAVTVEKVEEVPMDARSKKLARRVFAALRKHA
jgi:hypothetical protein